MEHLEKILQEIVGQENLSSAKPICESYVTKGIMETKSKAPAVVARPKDIDEVRKILILANEKRFLSFHILEA
jgi:FAD/FMN-containing dehydrogenase